MPFSLCSYSKKSSLQTLAEVKSQLQQKNASSSLKKKVLKELIDPVSENDHEDKKLPPDTGYYSTLVFLFLSDDTTQNISSEVISSPFSTTKRKGSLMGLHPLSTYIQSPPKRQCKVQSLLKKQSPVRRLPPTPPKPPFILLTSNLLGFINFCTALKCEFYHYV